MILNDSGTAADPVKKKRLTVLFFTQLRTEAQCLLEFYLKIFNYSFIL